MIETDKTTLDRLDRARQFCIDAHAGQFRSDGRPYATHPIEVVEALRAQGVTDVDVLAAGYLHDVLEDTDIPRQRLVDEFGEDVAKLVDEMTNKDYPGRTYEDKHRALAEHAKIMSDRAKMIKLADRLNNSQVTAGRTVVQLRDHARVTVDLLEALRPWPLPQMAEEIQKAIAPYLNPA